MLAGLSLVSRSIGRTRSAARTGKSGLQDEVHRQRLDKERLMKGNRYFRTVMVAAAFWAMFTYFPPI
jgi:hypothetical protein